MQSKNKPLIVSLIISATIGVAIISFPNTFSIQQAQISKRDIPKPKDREMMPIPFATQESNSLEKSKRENKNRQYNHSHGEDLMTQNAGEIFGRDSELPAFSAIPTFESDLVVIGKIIKTQPYLSESNTSIYSEFTIQIEEIVKNDFSQKLKEGKSVIADKEGGAILMPNGQVLKYMVSGIGALPKQGERYLLFLKNFSKKIDYEIITAYELQDGKVFSLENYADRSQFEGLDESAFISKVKQSVY